MSILWQFDFFEVKYVFSSIFYRGMYLESGIIFMVLEHDFRTQKSV